MSTKHTPGPWFVSDQFGSVGAIASKEGFIGFPCAVRKPGEEKQPGESWLDMRDRTQADRLAIEQEKDANARLIAAAPELLEELKYLVEVAESAMRAANRDGGEYDIGEMLQAPLAAIAKATGEQQ